MIGHLHIYIYIYIYIIYIYIYIYIYYIVQSVPHLSFIHSAIIGQSEDFWKKQSIWLIFCSKSGGYLCVCVPKFVYYWMLVWLCMCCCSSGYIYVCLCMYWNASLHNYTYFCYQLMGRSGMKEESVRREEWVREGGMDCCNQNFFFQTP